MNPSRTALRLLALAPFSPLALVAQDSDAPVGAFPESEAAAHAAAYDEALARSAWDKAVASLVLKIRAENTKRDEGEGDALRALEKAADSAPEPMRAPLRALLAHHFRAYYDNHSHELSSRTAGGSGDKIEGWDGPRLLREVDARFRSALADEAALRAAPIDSYSAITDGKSGADAARPTLFDFLAYDAFAYYTGRSRFRFAPDESPLFPDDSPLVGDTDEFLAWRPAGDTAPVRAVALLQRLLRAHRTHPEAFAEAELTRLRWAREACAGESAARRVRAQLKRLIETHGATRAAAMAHAEIAESLLASGDPKGCLLYTSPSPRDRG